MVNLGSVLTLGATLAVIRTSMTLTKPVRLKTTAVAIVAQNGTCLPENSVKRAREIGRRMNVYATGNQTILFATFSIAESMISRARDNCQLWERGTYRRCHCPSFETIFPRTRSKMAVYRINPKLAERYSRKYSRKTRSIGCLDVIQHQVPEIPK
jgi:hypothetical protein